MPVRIEDPKTHKVYLLVDVADESEDEDKIVRAMYPAIDEAFREGWDDPAMSDYDDYEAHKP